MKHKNYQIISDSEADITAVKRLSDGEIFGIGDIVYCKSDIGKVAIPHPKKIKSFRILDNWTLWVNENWVSFDFMVRSSYEENWEKFIKNQGGENNLHPINRLFAPFNLIRA